MKRYTVGVDIGGTKCAVVLGKGSVADCETKDFILDKVKIPTVFEDGPGGMMRSFLNVQRNCLQNIM